MLRWKQRKHEQQFLSTFGCIWCRSLVESSCEAIAEPRPSSNPMGGIVEFNRKAPRMSRLKCIAKRLAVPAVLGAVCTNTQIWGPTPEGSDRRCDRYLSASTQLEAFGGQANAADVMKVMGSISFDDWTMWSSVYNLTKNELLFLHRKPRTGMEPVRISI